MYKQYLKQALRMLKENKLLSIISIAGTALAICMIMVIVLLYEIKTANYRPETKRNRTMYVKWGGALNKSGKEQSNSMVSLHTIKECCVSSKIAEIVSAVAPYGTVLSSVPGGKEEFDRDALYTDANFWKIFDFAFLEGKPFLQEEFESGVKKAVIDESTARLLFETTSVLGRVVEINYVSYTVCGVVRDVSKFAESAYAQVWLPYTTNKGLNDSDCDDLLGSFGCYILARSANDFDAIHAEVDHNVARISALNPNYRLTLRGQPDGHFSQMFRKFANIGPDIKGIVLKFGIVITILLFVPAINLSGMTLSRMRKRMSEIGVRKAFGATRTELLKQVLSENLFLTLLGGLFGLILSYFSLFLLRNWLLASDLGGVGTLNVEMMFRPIVFVYAFCFCLVMNLLSAGIPAWRVSRMNIVNALNEK